MYARSDVEVSEEWKNATASFGCLLVQETNDFGCGTHIEILLKVPLPIGRFFVRESSTTTTTTTTTRKELAF